MLIKMLLIIILAAITVFVLLKIRAVKQKLRVKQQAPTQRALPEVVEFSGDNRLDTELDLARAYIELRQLDKAKSLLKSVITQGDAVQITEARKMFTLLLKQERESKPKVNTL